MSRWIKPLRPWLQLAGVALAVGMLYAAREILVPVTFALLLTFTLAPAANFAQRFLGRVASVVVVVVLAFSFLGAVGWTVTTQLASLAASLPAYRENVHDKVADIRLASRGGSLEKVQEAVRDIQEEMTRPEEGSPPSEPEQVPVVEEESAPAALGPMSLAALIDALASAGLIVVFVVFMLLERHDLRNRLIRLLGAGRITIATKALDEAGTRITRYLSRHVLINGSFGLGVGIGLFLLDVPYALLWGCLAALLRFAPYVGPWIGAIAPFLLSLAVFPGWTRPLMVAGLFIVAELFTNLVMEPLLYSGAAGVSTVGLLVSLAFWTWLWGPLGLVMGTPLTVCLVVVGKYVPSMSFLATLLGDAPALKPAEAYYQRLLARDRDEAASIVETYLATAAAPEKVFDELAIPALCQARSDADAGHLSAAEEAAIVHVDARILDDALGTTRDAPETADAAPALGYPASGESEELALRWFRGLLAPASLLEVASSRLLSSELVELVGGRSVVCLVALPPGDLHHVRYLCKRLRAAHPRLKILVGRWGPPGLGGVGADALIAAGADAVGATLLESRAQLVAALQDLARAPAAEPRTA